MNDTEVLAEFDRLGKDASYHFADDSGNEWGLANKAMREALALFDANPQLQSQMRELAKGFLWSLSFELSSRPKA